MAMKNSRYQYETSPRKINPEYRPYKSTPKTKNNNTKRTKTSNVQNKKIKKEQEKQLRKKMKIIVYILLGFTIVFSICYRNAKIDEKFSNIQSLKQELSETEKQNAQLEIAIESGLNLNNLAKQARELLGMQKLTNKQTVYVDAPKNDYIQSATEEIKIEDENNIMTKITNSIMNIF